ncbi:MAG: hypothetical protein JHC38_06165 [Thiotrichales bacterium]|jgi:phage host-nuclease inhibitor protein Gam|nr:hypothetical protein [Thiotrichales bacterium]
MANGFTKAREQYSQLLAELTSERDRIKSFSDTLFNDSDEIQSTQTQINQLIVNLEKLTTEATSKVSKINEKYNELLIDGEDGTLATATEIHNAKHDILAIKT